MPGTVAGAGEAAAAAFLQQLRAVVAKYPTVLLPAGDPDVVALVRGGLTASWMPRWRRDARSPTGCSAGNSPRGWSPSMSLPVAGALEPATLTALTDAGLTSCSALR